MKVNKGQGLNQPNPMMGSPGQMTAPQYMIPPGMNNLSNYNFGYQQMPGYMIPQIPSKVPTNQNMPYYVDYQYGYVPQGYPPAYYGQIPSNEYLEQRRISMPVRYQVSNPEQRVPGAATDLDARQLPGQQQRPVLLQRAADDKPVQSNSMADALNVNSMGWQVPAQVKPQNVPPPGLNKNLQASKGYKETAANSKSNSGSDETSDPQAKEAEMNRVNNNFAKMSMGSKNHQKRANNSGGLMPATGEVSCHSNSTIKEEEFDSEREHDKESDNSSNKASQNDKKYCEQLNQNRMFYNSLLDEEFLKNQKRRESQQIQISSLEGK
eukprot:CAMPEP_0168340260 /NCGR_PEP_ID=MMETSP0213-20121227/13964_1 /TAXON_ID=151035 /ORGANISM="Euplotes harpa, Strain FSP1.4" /LENGTH=322 /DNA_ID=CAMNT_0008346475 /DNA_START=57 /DNA_END=1026 /DNA_ORIENTATION=-